MVSIFVGLLTLWCVLFFLTRQRYPVHHEGVIVVSGSSSGIGKHAVLELSKAGYHVFAGVRKERDGIALVEESSSCRVHPIILDVTSSENISNALRVVESFTRTTGLPLVGLINNAGVGYIAPAEYLDLDTTHWLFDINYFGVLELSKEFIPLLRASKGRVVNVGSIAGLFAGGMTAAYSASKFALEGMSDVARRELRSQGISVSLIEPGYIVSELSSKLEKETSIEQMDEEGRKRYEMEKTIQRMKEGFAIASPPSVTSEAIFDALTNPYPSTRYVVANLEGTPSWLIMRMFWILPSTVADLLLELTT